MSTGRVVRLVRGSLRRLMRVSANHPFLRRAAEVFAERSYQPDYLRLCDKEVKWILGETASRPPAWRRRLLEARSLAAQLRPRSTTRTVDVHVGSRPA